MLVIIFRLPEYFAANNKLQLVEIIFIIFIIQFKSIFFLKK